jgi:integrase
MAGTGKWSFARPDPLDDFQCRIISAGANAQKAPAARKTGQLVVWPVPATLKSILVEPPTSDAPTLAVNSRGKSWTEDGFRTSWRKLRLRLEAAGKVQPGLTVHGLRHTVATILREEGFDERTIADALGQKSESMARHYTRDADLTQKMTTVVESIDAAENRRRTKVVKPT